MSVSAFAAGTWAAQLVAAGLLVAGYGTVFVMLYRAARRRPGGHRVSIWHVLPFAVGVVLLVVAGAPPLSREADSLLVAHMLQHVLISDVAAALIVLGLRTPLLTLGLPRRTLRLMAPGSRLGAVIARMTSPVFAVAFFAVMQWTSAAPSVLEATQRSAAVHLVQHGLLLWSGMLLWWVVIDPLGAPSPSGTCCATARGRSVSDRDRRSVPPADVPGPQSVLVLRRVCCRPRV